MAEKPTSCREALWGEEGPDRLSQCDGRGETTYKEMKKSDAIHALHRITTLLAQQHAITKEIADRVMRLEALTAAVLEVLVQAQLLTTEDAQALGQRVKSP